MKVKVKEYLTALLASTVPKKKGKNKNRERQKADQDKNGCRTDQIPPVGRPRKTKISETWFFAVQVLAKTWQRFEQTYQK